MILWKLIVWHSDMPEPHKEMFISLDEAMAERKEWVIAHGSKVKCKVILNHL